MAHKQTEEEAKRSFAHGSSSATADMAVEGSKKDADEHARSDAPHARGAKPLSDGDKHDQLADKESSSESRQEALLDEAIEETFPGSDPISPKHIT